MDIARVICAGSVHLKWVEDDFIEILVAIPELGNVGLPALLGDYVCVQAIIWRDNFFLFVSHATHFSRR